MDYYLILLEDEGSYGHSEFMTKKEATVFVEEAKSNGYNIAAISLKTLFSSDRKLVPVERF